MADPGLIQAVSSPNYGPRRDGLLPSLVVLHYTAMSDAQSALARLCDPKWEVSCHYLIGRCGTVWRLVPEQERAWHAGAGSWQGQSDINSRSIGIELDNDGASPFSELLMARLERLLADVCARWSISVSGVIAHSDMAPGRKSDPGPRFDWRRLDKRGLAIGPMAPGHHDCPLSESLDAIGYPRVAEQDRLSAFRLRFRQGAAGPECAEDRTIAATVAARFAVDRAEQGA